MSLSTKQPLKNAALRLRPPFPAASTPPNVDDAAYTTQTDAAGRFVFQDVDPGPYWLTAERQGYLRQEYGAAGPGRLGTVLNIEAGQTVKNLTVTLMPQGTIAGRVVDEDGEPVGSARVTASAVRYVNGAKRLFPVSFGEGNANGAFLLGNLPPGHYYLSAEKTGPVLVGGTAENTRSASSKEAYVRTYYPDTAELSGAAPVSVTPGAAVGGADIRMQKARVYRIRGNAEFPADLAPGAGRLLVLTPRNAFDLANITSRRMAVLRPDGSFEFEDVAPGDYILQPERMRLGGVVAGRTEVTVADRNLEGVNLMIFRAPDISGQVRFEVGTAQEAIQVQQAAVPAGTSTRKPPSTARSGREILPPPPPAQLALGRGQDEPKAVSLVEAPPSPAEPEQTQAQPGALVATAGQAPAEGALSGVHVSLGAAEGVSINAPRATSIADGTFRLTNVQTDRYRANVSQLPPRTYVKSVLYNGQDVTDSAMDVTAGGGTLEIVLSAKAGEITGVVRDDREKPAPNVFVSAWAASEPKREAADRTQMTATDANGTFRFRNLPPGEYRVAAWEDIDTGVAQYRPFCELFGSKAAKAELSENGRERVDVKLVPAAAIASAAARLPY